MHTVLQDTNRGRQSTYGSSRDYAIFTDWVNGASQATIARQFGLSPNRVHQIVGRFNRYYDSGVGSSFYTLISRMLSTKPMLYPVLRSSLGEQVLLCSVVVLDQDYLCDKAFCRTLAADLSVGELPWAIRKSGPARVAIDYLNSILEGA